MARKRVTEGNTLINEDERVRGKQRCSSALPCKLCREMQDGAGELRVSEGWERREGLKMTRIMNQGETGKKSRKGTVKRRKAVGGGEERNAGRQE